MTSLVPEHDQWAYHPKGNQNVTYGEWQPTWEALEASITCGQSRIDHIAKLIHGLTYGHMMALSAELASHGPITKDTLAKALWAWSTANAENDQRTMDGDIRMAVRTEPPHRTEI